MSTKPSEKLPVFLQSIGQRVRDEILHPYDAYALFRQKTDAFCRRRGQGKTSLFENGPANLNEAYVLFGLIHDEACDDAPCFPPEYETDQRPYEEDAPEDAAGDPERWAILKAASVRRALSTRVYGIERRLRPALNAWVEKVKDAQKDAADNYVRTPSYRGGRANLPDRFFGVWRDIMWAQKKSKRPNASDRDLYEWLKVNGRDECTAQSLSWPTWKRYATQARSLLRKQKTGSAGLHMG